jgi:hypothetical protein
MHLFQFLGDPQLPAFLELLETGPNRILLEDNPKCIFISIFNRDWSCGTEVRIGKKYKTIP